MNILAIIIPIIIVLASFIFIITDINSPKKGSA